MKKILFGFLALTALFAFTSLPDEELNCYQKYVQKFEERGAREVEDGWHEKVVVTFRQGSLAECWIGKVKVEKNEITQIHIRNSDGTYEIYTKKFKDDVKASITNGISNTVITVDGELVNVVFPAHINPPKKKFAPAPDPDDL